MKGNPEIKKKIVTKQRSYTRAIVFSACLALDKCLTLRRGTQRPDWPLKMWRQSIKKYLNPRGTCFVILGRLAAEGMHTFSWGDLRTGLIWKDHTRQCKFRSHPLNAVQGPTVISSQHWTFSRASVLPFSLLVFLLSFLSSYYTFFPFSLFYLPSLFYFKHIKMSFLPKPHLCICSLLNAIFLGCFLLYFLFSQ